MNSVKTMDKSMTLDGLILLFPRTKVEAAISRKFLSLESCITFGVCVCATHTHTHQTLCCRITTNNLQNF
jgi:hypothetical protein